jgi:hypothetical protein
MARKPKPSPLQVFEENIADAQRLVDLSRALVNGRKRKMRRELRESFGGTMGLPRKRWEDLDCVESDDVFLILKPDGNSRREHFTEAELRPLLRQAVVAIAAAVESYVAEKACCFVSDALRSNDPPRRLLDIPITFEQLLWVEETYTRRGWGHRIIVEDHLRAEASSDPAKIGQVLATVGKRQFWRQVDTRRGVTATTSEKQLRALAERRNVIAHTGDRVGRGKASLEIPAVQAHLSNAKAIVEALDETL